jgi:hypothetical protein
MTTTNSALVPSEPPKPPDDVAVAGFGDVFGRPDRPIVCSFNLKTPQGRELLQKCEEASDESLRELVNSELVIEHVYGKVFDYVNPTTQEVYPLLRIVVVTTDGQAHGCCADGVRESIWRLMAGHGPPPWKGGIHVVAKLKPTKKGFNRLTLLEVFAKPKGGAK